MALISSELPWTSCVYYYRPSYGMLILSSETLFFKFGTGHRMFIWIQLTLQNSLQIQSNISIDNRDELPLNHLFLHLFLYDLSQKKKTISNFKQLNNPSK